MNELTKTGVFAGIAAVLAFLVYITEAPRIVDPGTEAMQKVGEDLFPGFKDSLSICDLRVVKYDEGLGIHSEFEVAKDKTSGAWIIPSNDSYPADAADQMSKAANALIGIKILQLASERNDDQAMYGVVEPSAEKTQVGATGVGTLVRMSDAKGEALADIIIGKKVAGSETQRYVRNRGTDQIWIVEIDPANFPTDFKQWIDKDLLQLSSTDIEQLNFRKYDVVVQGNQGGIVKDFDATVEFNTADGKWNPVKVVKSTNNVDGPRELGADEVLNASKLNSIKTALDSLQISDVARKPEGLAANLKADTKLLQNQASMASLQSKGFYPFNGEILGDSGELIVTLKSGVQYLLRFGDTANTLSSDNTAGNSAATQGAKDISINRYLLVTAQLDESQIPQVELQKVPETIEEVDAMDAAKKAASQPATTPDKQVTPATEPQATDVKPAAETTPPPAAESTPAAPETPAPAEQSTSATEPAAPAANDGSSSTDESKTEPVAAQEEKAADAAPAEGEQPAKPAEQAPANAEQPATDGQQTPAAPAAAATPAAAPAAKPEETEQEKKERLEATRERITKENQRKIDERNDRLEEAKKKVEELNSKFAEWYYVIGESQYEKLTISLDDLIQNKNAAASPSIGQPGGAFPPGGFQGFPGQ